MDDSEGVVDFDLETSTAERRGRRQVPRELPQANIPENNEHAEMEAAHNTPEQRTLRPRTTLQKPVRYREEESSL